MCAGSIINDTMKTKIRSWYRIKNQSGDVAEIYIYDEIGEWGITAVDFIKDLKKIKADVIAVYINSPGGSVFDGFAIYNAILREREAGKIIETYIDGIAASIASVIALAGQQVSIARNGMFMIHNVTGMTWGTSKDHEKTAELLEKIEDQIADVYAQKTGIELKEIHKMMDEETWLTATEAQQKGFVDTIIREMKASAFLNPDGHVWKDFRNIPKEINVQTKGEIPMNKLLSLLGVESEDAAVEKVKGMLSENSDLKKENADLESENTKLSDTVKAQKVDKAISDGKLFPSQKEFALSLSDDQFESFLKSSKAQNLAQRDTLSNGGTSNVTYEDLLADPKEYVRMKDENPEMFDELRNAYLDRVK